MTVAVSPDLALGYLEALWPAMEAGVVLDGDGRRLAGPPWVAELVAGLAAELGPDGECPGERRSPTPRGELFVVRSAGHQVAVVVGAPVLADLLVHDMRQVLADLEDPVGERW